MNFWISILKVIESRHAKTAHEQERRVFSLSTAFDSTSIVQASFPYKTYQAVDMANRTTWTHVYGYLLDPLFYFAGCNPAAICLS